jgi:hypothetical protein
MSHHSRRNSKPESSSRGDAAKSVGLRLTYIIREKLSRSGRLLCYPQSQESGQSQDIDEETARTAKASSSHSKQKKNKKNKQTLISLRQRRGEQGKGSNKLHAALSHEQEQSEHGYVKRPFLAQTQLGLGHQGQPWTTARWILATSPWLQVLRIIRACSQRSSSRAERSSTVAPVGRLVE